MKWFFLTIILFTLFLGYSQQNEEPITVKKFNPVSSISIFNNTFNLNDYYYGFSMGVEDLGFEWGARFNFQFRPFFKRTLIQENSTTIRQYREKKYFISLDFDKRFFHFDLAGTQAQLFVGTQLGVLLGNYRATRISSKALFNVVPIGGLSFLLKDNTFLKIGFCYFKDDLIEVPDGKIVINLIFTLKENPKYQDQDVNDSNNEGLIFTEP